MCSGLLQHVLAAVRQRLLLRGVAAGDREADREERHTDERGLEQVEGRVSDRRQVERVERGVQASSHAQRRGGRHVAAASCGTATPREQCSVEGAVGTLRRCVCGTSCRGSAELDKKGSLW